MEGRITIQQVTHFKKRADQATPTEVDALASMGIVVGGLAMVDVQGLAVEVSLTPKYIYCCSDVPDFERAKRDNLKIFEITNLGKFAQEVARARPDLLGTPVLGTVSYRVRSGDPFLVGALFPDPFIKPASFETERELRIVWEPAGSGKACEIIEVPAVSQLLKSIF